MCLTICDTYASKVHQPFAPYEPHDFGPVGDVWPALRPKPLTDREKSVVFVDHEQFMIMRDKCRDWERRRRAGEYANWIVWPRRPQNVHK